MATSIKKAVALLSGGLDSAVAMALSHETDCDIVLALTFDYGQRSREREIAQSRAIAHHYKIPHRVIELPWFRGLRSGLLRGQEGLPTPSLEDLSNREVSTASAKAVWVPNRNGVFIEIAAGVAEDMGAAGVIVGFNREEAATFPDNSFDYLVAITHALSYSTSNRVQLLSPTVSFTKSEIVATGKDINFPFPLLWSCYEEGEKMCGRCESCMRLKRALSDNEVSLDDLFSSPALG